MTTETTTEIDTEAIDTEAIDTEAIDTGTGEPAAADYDALRESADTTDPEGTEATEDTPGREAAKWRRKLRDVESERDTLRARLDVLQRGEVERLATDRLRDATDVWRDGAQIADVLDASGDVDPAKVDTLIDGLVAAHQHWALPRPPLRASASRSGASGETRPRADPFVAAFKPREHD